MRLIIWFATASLLTLSSFSKADEPLRRACALISAAEMTAILGGAVTAKGDDRSGQTKCTYSATQGPSPYAELQLSWGDGEAGMAGAGMVGRQLTPGIVNPYAGLGDQATAVGPMLLIKRGEDLISLVLSGVENMPAKAKQLYDMLDQRLPKSPAPQRPTSSGTEPKPAKAVTSEAPPPERANLLQVLDQMQSFSGQGEVTVKAALMQSYKIADARLAAGGYGEASPK